MGKPLDIFTFTVTRRPGAWGSDGDWAEGTPSTYSLDASRPQPLGPETAEMLPEGMRSTARFVIYAEDSEPEVYLVGRDREDYSADTVAYAGDNYLVTSIDIWDSMPLGYRSYVLLAYGPDEAS